MVKLFIFSLLLLSIFKITQVKAETIGGDYLTKGALSEQQVSKLSTTDISKATKLTINQLIDKCIVDIELEYTDDNGVVDYTLITLDVINQRETYCKERYL